MRLVKANPILVIQCKIEDVDVRSKVLRCRGFGNRYDSVLVDEPAESDLSWILAVFTCDFL